MSQQMPPKSGLATIALVLGIVALVPLVGIPFAIAAIVCGAIAIGKSGQPPYPTGRGKAMTGIILGVVGVIVVPIFAVLIAILLPSLSKAKELSDRSTCAANLRGIANSMMIYADANSDQFPVYPYAPYSSSNAGTSTRTGTSSPNTTIDNLYRSGDMNGSVLGAQWIMVLNGLAPKLYVCKSDPHVKAPAVISAGDYYTNFQSGDQISYSFAYPYGYQKNPIDGKDIWSVGSWWKNTVNAAIPVAADMAPLNGTGNPARNVTPRGMPSSPKSWNSGNHGGDGQNVVYADVHVEYVKRPDIGEAGDNIYSLGGPTGPTDYNGTQPVKTPIKIYTTIDPYDTYMVPARNLDTGGL